MKRNIYIYINTHIYIYIYKYISITLQRRACWTHGLFDGGALHRPCHHEGRSKRHIPIYININMSHYQQTDNRQTTRQTAGETDRQTENISTYQYINTYINISIYTKLDRYTDSERQFWWRGAPPPLPQRGALAEAYMYVNILYYLPCCAVLWSTHRGHHDNNDSLKFTLWRDGPH